MGFTALVIGIGFCGLGFTALIIGIGFGGLGFKAYELMMGIGLWGRASVVCFIIRNLDLGIVTVVYI